jgi:hypothetical protein
MEKDQKGKKPAVWKNYFHMLRKAGLPWAMMFVCLLVSFGRAEVTLILTDRIGSVLQGSYPDLSQAIVPLLILLALGLAIVLLKVLGATFKES